MSEAKHTPWYVDCSEHEEERHVRCVKNQKGERVAQEMSLHDACLIAAAPELLEALEKIVSISENADDSDIGSIAELEMLGVAKSAIKNARGE